MEIRVKKKSWSERHPIRSAILYFVLTLVFITFIGTSGIALVTKLSAVLVDKKDVQSTPSDQTVLPVPNLDQIPTITNQTNFVLRGTSQPGSTVRIFLNNQPSDVLVNANGAFSTNITLRSGTNTIRALTTDTSGNISRDTGTYQLILDTTAPTLVVDSPDDQAQITGSKNKILTISGSIDESGSVKVNDRIAIVANSGKFSIDFTLNDGENTFTIVATDEAGNQSQIVRTVTFSE